jgi:NAD(P)-dependent dehydrogenase (short-subunit alcohol dehydrogenase family)
MIATATLDFGGVDIVFNNAGVGGAFGPVTRTEVEDWDYTFAVLARGGVPRRSSTVPRRCRLRAVAARSSTPRRSQA